MIQQEVRRTAKGKFDKWLEPDALLLLEGWARDGLTDEQIAHNMGVRRETLCEWKKKYPNISNALKKGKEVVDIEVENKLLKRALGYEYIEERVEISDHGGRKVTQTTKHVIPDTTAQIFWLKNRRPDKWRDRPEEQKNEDEGQQSGVISIPAVDMETFERMKNDELQRMKEAEQNGG